MRSGGERDGTTARGMSPKMTPAQQLVAGSSPAGLEEQPGFERVLSGGGGVEPQDWAEPPRSKVRKDFQQPRAPARGRGASGEQRACAQPRDQEQKTRQAPRAADSRGCGAPLPALSRCTRGYSNVKLLLRGPTQAERQKRVAFRVLGLPTDPPPPPPPPPGQRK